MKRLSEDEFIREMQPALSRVFVSEEPYGEPFAVAVVERRLLYPVSKDLLREHRSLFDAIASSATGLGDDSFYLSIMGRIAPGTPAKPNHWSIGFDEVDRYEEFDYVVGLEHMLYSPSGTWGIMLSHEDHGLLGGTGEFMESMQRALPGFDDAKQIRQFLSQWKYNSEERGADISWLPRLLGHVCGEQQATDLLTEAGLGDLLRSSGSAADV